MDTEHRPLARLPVNRLLDALPPDAAALVAQLHPVDLAADAELLAAGHPVEDVHFPLDAVVSLQAVLSDGTHLEVATVGREGLVGLPVYLGSARSPLRAVVVVPGQALRASTGEFRRMLLQVDGPMAVVVQRYAQTLFTQLGQNVVCRHSHTVGQQTARWLRVVDDTVEGAAFALTHEALALTLGVRRAGVTEAASRLADDGCISYSRGRVRVLDRDALQRAACECYGVVADVVERMTRAGGQAAAPGSPLPTLG